MAYKKIYSINTRHGRENFRQAAKDINDIAGDLKYALTELTYREFEEHGEELIRIGEALLDYGQTGGGDSNGSYLRMADIIERSMDE